ncbi:T9SS type A sorting domain-containing protein [bacterium]|nr:T9SS type A sorting domain-containing protein [bacterium]
MMNYRYLFMMLVLLGISAGIGYAVELELDEIIGDTVQVGMSALDNQHNVTIGRTIVHSPVALDGAGRVAVIFADLTLDGVTRDVRINYIHEGAEGELVVEGDNGVVVSGGTRAGYPGLAIDHTLAEPIYFPIFHDRTQQGEPWRVTTSSDWSLFPGIWTAFELPYSDDAMSVTQSKIAADGDSVIHVVAGESSDELGKLIYYKLGYDRNTEQFELLNPDGDEEIVTEFSSTSNGNIAVSPDGQRVAIAKNMNRGHLGLIDSSASFDSDLVIWFNDNRGIDWDFEADMFNVTRFHNPNPDLLPDTLAADVDTFRAQADNSLFFDDNNVMHVAFEALPYFHYEQTALIFGQIFYWNEEDDYFVRIADGNFFLNASPTSYGSMVGHPQFTIDDDGWMWCLYQQYGTPGDTLDNGAPRDGGENGYLNGEMYVTASPPGQYSGKLWFKGVNITNTFGTEGAIPAGDCRNERDGSLALNCDGAYLHILYLTDYDSGNFDNGNGSMTDNPLYYHRVAKQELIDLYMQQQEFVPGLSMYVDGTHYWEDPEGWEWRDITSVKEASEHLAPTQFALDEVYPNPFNSMTRISFSLQKQGQVSLVVYDLMGREVATILNRTMNHGQHFINFDGNDLSSGVYFISLQSGEHRDTRKIMLLK